MINATLASGLTGTATQSASQVSSNELQESYNSFLTLLTAQISNQDPLEPVDSTQFVSQLAQLTQVEQSISTNANLESISSMLATMGAMSDMQMIGRNVLVPSSQVTMTDTEFPLSYQVEPGATDVKIRIYSQEGSLVRELTGSSVADGELIDVAWDRRDAVGLPTPPGNFRIEIAATDVNGDPIAATSLTTSGVERVNFTARGPELQLSNGETVLSQVVRSVL
jgi:flagellar basal-body rod modification protein FlgD